MYRESNAAKWATQFDFPAVQSGDIVKSEISHQRPTGIWGFVMNTRRPQFQDWRVREALTQAFNFEFINQTLNGDPQPRITSYFSNSVLGMQPGPAEGRVRAFLEPYAADLLPGALDGYAPPAAASPCSATTRWSGRPRDAPSVWCRSNWRSTAS